MTAPYETLNEANEQYCSGVARIFENPFYKWLIEDGNLQTSYTNSLHDTALFSLYFLYIVQYTSNPCHSSQLSLSLLIFVFLGRSMGVWIVDARAIEHS